jgi:hypothetical protein
VDVGPRQMGRERGLNVRHVEYGRTNILRALGNLSDDKSFTRNQSRNIYGGNGAGARIAAALAALNINPRLGRKLISY